MTLKGWLCVAAGAAATGIETLIGGWTVTLTTLLICMSIDYVTGIITAAVFHKSQKSKSGALESHAGLKGLFKKVGMLLAVVIAYQLDKTVGSDWARNTVIVGLISNEIISVMENLKIMGVPLFSVFDKALDVMREKYLNNNDESQEEEENNVKTEE